MWRKNVAAGASEVSVRLGYHYKTIVAWTVVKMRLRGGLDMLGMFGMFGGMCSDHRLFVVVVRR